MRIRKLQIAWSVGWGLVAVLLIAMWVRSYKHDDALQAFSPSSTPLVLRSFKGQLSYWRHGGVNAARRVPTKRLNENLDELLIGIGPTPRFFWDSADSRTRLAPELGFSCRIGSPF
jgi:hypothetical protein